MVGDPDHAVSAGWGTRITAAPPRVSSREGKTHAGCGVHQACVSRHYFGAGATVSPGGKILNVKIVTLSPGLNGPGTSFLTGGMLCRKAAMADASSFVR